MPWLKLDDAMGGHRKTRRLLRRGATGVGLMAFGLHSLALLHCSEYLTDGFVEHEFVDETLDDANVRGKQRTVVVHALIDGGQWEEVDGGWQIHGYLDYNPSRAEILAKRAADAERKARGRRTQSKGSPNGVRSDRPKTDSGVTTESDRPVPSRPVHIPSDTPKPPAGVGKVEREARRLQDRADEQAVFDAWVAATRRTPQTLFDDARRKAIRKGLDLFGLEACLTAVRGVAASDHHMSKPQYSEPRVVLRDAGQIEHFVALSRRAVGVSTAAVLGAYRSAGGGS